MASRLRCWRCDDRNPDGAARCQVCGAALDTPIAHYRITVLAAYARAWRDIWKRGILNGHDWNGGIQPSQADLARCLNARGLRTPSGLPWTARRLSGWRHALRRRG